MTDQKPTYVFATNNPHKLEEVRRILGESANLLSLSDIGCTDDIPEEMPTLQGNALAKARWVRNRFGYNCFADDTGLEVEALGGAPGVHSARYAGGSGHDSNANMALLLKNLEGVDNRKADFRTVIALIDNDGEHFFEGRVDGHIAWQPSGSNGFGYDPVFVPEGHSRTFAEFDSDEKNAISHRGRAIAALAEYLDINKI